jgi:enoyl-[acyl-carrier-protein] reductase (NADH)
MISILVVWVVMFVENPVAFWEVGRRWVWRVNAGGAGLLRTVADEEKRDFRTKTQRREDVAPVAKPPSNLHRTECAQLQG